MKRFALSLVFGVVLAMGSGIVSADTSTSGTSGSLTGLVLCAMGFNSYCASPDGASDPAIKNK